MSSVFASIPHRHRRLRAILSTIFALIMASLLATACAGQPARTAAPTSPSPITYHMNGPSMLPIIHVNQLLTVQPYGAAQPQRGDIVVFHPPYDSSANLIKRIIGLPGESVRVDADGKVFINGTRLSEPYLNDATNPYQPNTWTLASDQYFVMGDNRSNSSDSRDWGPVHRSSIIGKVIAIPGS